MGKAMRWQEAVKLLIPMADALGYAHARGVIQRDVKSSNILITESGKPMLTDFGIAKAITAVYQMKTQQNLPVGAAECCAAAPGVIVRVSCEYPSATRVPLTTQATSASVASSRSELEG